MLPDITAICCLVRLLLNLNCYLEDKLRRVEPKHIVAVYVSVVVYREQEIRQPVKS